MAFLSRFFSPQTSVSVVEFALLISFLGAFLLSVDSHSVLSERSEIANFVVENESMQTKQSLAVNISPKVVAGAHVRHYRMLKESTGNACKKDKQKCKNAYKVCRKQAAKSKKRGWLCREKRRGCLKKLEQLKQECKSKIKQQREKEKAAREAAEKAGQESGSGGSRQFLGELFDDGVGAASTSGVTINYFGGAIMGPPVLNVYLIYYGQWEQSAKSIIYTFLQSLSSDSGQQGEPGDSTVQNWWAITTAYTQTNPAKSVADIVQVASQVDVVSTGAWLSEDDIWRIVSEQLDSTLPVDPNGLYLVLTDPDTYVGDFCKVYCGWHTWNDYNGNQVPFGFIGNAVTQCPNGCISGRSQTSNGDPGVDGVVNVIAHEVAEAASDPFPGSGRAWQSDSGDENADMCASEFGGEIDTGEYYYNLVGLDGLRFYIQSNWDPVLQQCAIQGGNNGVYDPSPPPPSPPPPPPPRKKKSPPKKKRKSPPPPRRKRRRN